MTRTLAESFHRIPDAADADADNAGDSDVDIEATVHFSFFFSRILFQEETIGALASIHSSFFVWFPEIRGGIYS